MLSLYRKRVSAGLEKKIENEGLRTYSLSNVLSLPVLQRCLLGLRLEENRKVCGGDEATVA